MTGITKTYQMGQVRVEALKETSLDIYAGELLVILGPSGSGKTPACTGRPQRTCCCSAPLRTLATSRRISSRLVRLRSPRRDASSSGAADRAMQ